MYIIKAPIPGHILYYQEHIPAADGNPDIITLTKDINLAKAFEEKGNFFDFDITDTYNLVDGVHDKSKYDTWDDPIRDYIRRRIEASGRRYGYSDRMAIAELIGWGFVKVKRTTIEEDEECI